jgi:hypothetical protein
VWTSAPPGENSKYFLGTILFNKESLLALRMGMPASMMTLYLPIIIIWLNLLTFKGHQAKEYEVSSVLILPHRGVLNNLVLRSGGCCGLFTSDWPCKPFFWRRPGVPNFTMFLAVLKAAFLTQDDNFGHFLSNFYRRWTTFVLSSTLRLLQFGHVTLLVHVLD